MTDSPGSNEAASPGACGAPANAPIAAPAIRGSIWTIGGYATSSVLRLGSNLILTRLLFPAVFGEMALVFIFIQGLQMFSDIGTGPAIVQNRDGDEPSFLNTAWTLQVVRGVLLWLASWLVAWPAAAFYANPDLRWLIPGAGITAVIAGFESTSIHSAQRHLRLARFTILDLASQLSGIVVTVLLAYADRSLYGADHPGAVWAIVGGNLVTGLTRLVLSHTYLPGIRNRFARDPAALKQLVRFGRWVFVSTLLTFLAAQLDRLMLGKMIPMALFGVYNVAYQFTTMPVLGVQRLVHSVLFPAYSKAKERVDFQDLFWRGRQPLLLAGAAMVSFLVAAGPSLMHLLYDRRYDDAGWIVQYLAVAAWFHMLESANAAVLLALGRLKWMAGGYGLKIATMAIAIPVGFRIGGFRGAIAGAVLSEVAKYLGSSAGVVAAGLRIMARDAALAAGVVASAAAGTLAERAVVEAGVGRILAFLAAAAISVAPWSVVGLRYVLRARAARSMREGLGAPAPPAA